MNTETIKKILLCKDAIEKSREVLADTLEDVDGYHMDGKQKSSKDDIYCLMIFCKKIKKETDYVDRYLADMKEHISEDDGEEIEDAVVRIEDILVDDLSMPKTRVELIEPVSHEEMAAQIFSMDKVA